MPYKHRDCGGLVENVEGPEPPDPDRHGNMYIAHKCAACGERFTITCPPHGGTMSPEELIEIDDRGVPPAVVCEEPPNL